MQVKSMCPKCGKEGSQYITHQSNKTGLTRSYLEIVHTKNRRCYIGRIRTTEEAMGELNKPQTVKEYEKVLKNLSVDIRNLTKDYSPNTALLMKIISKRLDFILKKYGY